MNKYHIKNYLKNHLFIVSDFLKIMLHFKQKIKLKLSSYLLNKQFKKNYNKSTLKGVFAPGIQYLKKKRILLVSDSPLRREFKIAFGLKKVGKYEVILVKNEGSYIDDELKSDFVDIVDYKAPLECREICDSINVPLVHHFTNSADEVSFELANIKKSKKIIDIYDNFQLLSSASKLQKIKYCLDIANQKKLISLFDGLVFPDLQFKFKDLYKKANNWICFPNYCWNIAHSSSIPKKRENVEIVQSGWMGFETNGNYETGSFLVTEKLVRSGCTVHLIMHPYASPEKGTLEYERLYKHYLDLNSETGRIKIHKTITNVRTLLADLSKYDFGLNMNNAGNFKGIKHKIESKRFLEYVISGRLFDYLDSNLSLIIDGSLKFNKFLFKGVAIDGSELLKSGSIYDNLMEQKKGKQIIIKELKEKLSIEKNIPRLIKFYENIA